MFSEDNSTMQNFAVNFDAVLLRILRARGLPQGIPPNTNKKAAALAASYLYLVEPRGIEPLTSSLPAKRSPS